MHTQWLVALSGRLPQDGACTHTHSARFACSPRHNRYTIGPIPWNDADPTSQHAWGKEIVTRYDAPTLASAKTWYSDSNGRDSNKRVRDFRPTWNYSVQEPIAGNYVPVRDGFPSVGHERSQMELLLRTGIGG